MVLIVLCLLPSEKTSFSSPVTTGDRFSRAITEISNEKRKMIQSINTFKSVVESLSEDMFQSAMCLKQGFSTGMPRHTWVP